MSDTTVVVVPEPEPDPEPEQPTVVVVEPSSEGSTGQATDLDHERRITALEEWRNTVEERVSAAEITADVAESAASAALEEALSEPEPVVVEEPEPEPEPEPDEAPKREHWFFRS